LESVRGREQNVISVYKALLADFVKDFSLDLYSAYKWNATTKIIVTGKKGEKVQVLRLQNYFLNVYKN
jgi:hypothetical protein